MITISDSTGNIGDAATTKGYSDAIKAIESVFDSGEGLTLKSFFDTGKTKNPKDAASDAMYAATRLKNKYTESRSTLVNIAQLLNKAEQFAVAE